MSFGNLDMQNAGISEERCHVCFSAREGSTQGIMRHSRFWSLSDPVNVWCP